MFNHRVSDNSKMEERFTFPRQKVYFKNSDNLKLAAWYTKAQDPKAFVILVHGFTESNGGKALMLEHAQYLQQAGYSSLAIDLRATGDSEGNRTYLGTQEYKDVESAYDYLKTLPEAKFKKIGCLGISMGAATCTTFMGVTGKGDFLIASVPYANLVSLFDYNLDKEDWTSQLLK